MRAASLFLVLFTACTCYAECLIVAHRGASNVAPENTVEAIKKAWALQADAVEVDLRLSKDGVIVIYHDGDTERIGGRRGLVKDQTFSQLQELDVGQHKGSQFKGIKIPRLGEVLAAIPDDKTVFLELKAGAKIMPPLTETLTSTTLQRRQIKLIGFDIGLMKAAKARFPEIEVYWLVEISTYLPYERWSEAARDAVATAREAGVDGMCVAANSVVNPQFVSLANSARLKFFLYTIDSGSAARRYAKMGIDGIITNRPDYVRDNIKSVYAP